MSMFVHKDGDCGTDGRRTDAFSLKKLKRLGGRVRRHLQRMPARAVERGLPPSWVGYRWVGHESVATYLQRTSLGTSETIHSQSVARNPLPMNVTSRGDLPAERNWWGYSMRDVPTRTNGETVIATVPDCRIVSFVEPAKRNFYPCILNRDGRALNLREIAFRPGHRAAIRSSESPVRIAKATWILERVYHNHSHWLTAHLPKLCLLIDRQETDSLILPAPGNPVIDASLRMLGLRHSDFHVYDPSRPLDIEELTILVTDRFRPELLQPVRPALSPAPARPAWRRIFISRAKSKGRRLIDEENLWPDLQRAGFERVFMEELDFYQQIRLMAETAILLAPHGAGLTNMMFCPPGAHILEISDPGFPNPNFYALACAMDHNYWLIPGEGVGDGHPLERNLRIDPETVRDALDQVERRVAGAA